MKIAYIIDGLRIGGKERQLALILEHCRKFDIEPLVISFKQAELCYDIFSDYTLRTHILARKYKFSFKVIAQIDDLLGSEKIDLIHSFDTISTFLAFRPAKKRGIPLLDGSIRDAGVNKGWQYVLRKAGLLLADEVLANSYAGLAYYGMQKKGEVVYNLIDSSQSMTSDSDPRNVVMTANFSEYKDHPTLLTAAFELIRNGVIKKLYLVGDGPRKDECEKLVESKGFWDSIIFIGRLTNIDEILRNCGTGVLSSTRKYREGISNTILEYMKYGLAVVASASGGTPEIIDSGKNGLLFTPGKPEELAEKLQTAIEDVNLRENMISRSFDILEQKFSALDNMSRLVSIYHDMISGRL